MTEIKHSVTINSTRDYWAMFRWCEEYAGKKKVDWKIRVKYRGGIVPAETIFFFAEESMATLFTLKWI